MIVTLRIKTKSTRPRINEDIAGTRQMCSGMLYCGRRGHGYRTCPERCGFVDDEDIRLPTVMDTNPSEEGSQVTTDAETRTPFLCGNRRRCSLIQVRMGKRTVSALIDSCAKPSVIDLRTLQDLELGKDIVSAQVWGRVMSRSEY